MFTENKLPVGRMGGVPVVLDISFIVLVVLYGAHYFTSGDSRRILLGIFVVAGGVGSILLHELAHAWAGRICGLHPTHIELNGLGGLCGFSGAPATRQESIFVSLSGPAANLGLWALFYWLDDALMDRWFHSSAGAGEFTSATFSWWVSSLFSTLAGLNIGLFVFNMLPAFPLDGGKSLSTWLGEHMPPLSARGLVAMLGLAVAAWCAYAAFRDSAFWMLVLALTLVMSNREVLQYSSHPPWRRWN